MLGIPNFVSLYYFYCVQGDVLTWANNRHRHNNHNTGSSALVSSPPYTTCAQGHCSTWAHNSRHRHNIHNTGSSALVSSNPFTTWGTTSNLLQRGTPRKNIDNSNKILNKFTPDFSIKFLYPPSWTLREIGFINHSHSWELLVLQDIPSLNENSLSISSVVRGLNGSEVSAIPRPRRCSIMIHGFRPGWVADAAYRSIISATLLYEPNWILAHLSLVTARSFKKYDCNTMLLEIYTW